MDNDTIKRLVEKVKSHAIDAVVEAKDNNDLEDAIFYINTVKAMHRVVNKMARLDNMMYALCDVEAPTLEQRIDRRMDRKMARDLMFGRNNDL